MCHAPQTCALHCNTPTCGGTLRALAPLRHRVHFNWSAILHAKQTAPGAPNHHRACGAVEGQESGVWRALLPNYSKARLALSASIAESASADMQRTACGQPHKACMPGCQLHSPAGSRAWHQGTTCCRACLSAALRPGVATKQRQKSTAAGMSCRAAATAPPTASLSDLHARAEERWQRCSHGVMSVGAAF